MILFVVIVFLLVWDIAEDLAAGTTIVHVLMESLMMLVAAFGALYFWNQYRVAKQAAKALKRDLKRARAEAAHWQEKEQDLLNRLREAVEQQFTQWDFSPSQKQIALYLLKGMSLKEIAQIKGSTFTSIRQQAHVLYHQAGLGGRAELSAFFLGGLLPPEEDSSNTTAELKSR
jgi:DNA-binding NarL/FixJ family response regulator